MSIMSMENIHITSYKYDLLLIWSYYFKTKKLNTNSLEHGGTSLIFFYFT